MPSELEAFSAINRAADLWRQRARSGDAVARAVALVLGELGGAAWCRDLESLDGKSSPAAWARSRQERAAKALGGDRPVLPTVPGKGGAPREFLYLLDAQLKADATPNKIASVAIHWCETRGVETGFLEATIPNLSSAAAVERRRSMRKAVLAVHDKRTAPDAKAYGVAALKAWGLTRDARNALKNADV